jgi:hypothetical protein
MKINFDTTKNSCKLAYGDVLVTTGGSLYMIVESCQGYNYKASLLDLKNIKIVSNYESLGQLEERISNGSLFYQEPVKEVILKDRLSLSLEV